MISQIVLEPLRPASPILEPVSYFEFCFYLYIFDFGFLLLATELILGEYRRKGELGCLPLKTFR